MKYSKIAVRSALACAVACSFAASSFAQNSVAPNAINKVAAEAKAAAEKAEANAKAAAEKSVAAAKSLAEIRKGVIPLPPKGFGAKFHPSLVKPYSDNLNGLLAQMKLVTTPQHAIAFGEKFKASLPSMETSHKNVMAAFADAINSGEKTADNTAAEKMLTEAAVKSEAIDKEMDRIEKLHASVKVHFVKFRAMQD